LRRPKDDVSARTPPDLKEGVHVVFATHAKEQFGVQFLNERRAPVVVRAKGKPALGAGLLTPPLARPQDSLRCHAPETFGRMKRRGRETRAEREPVVVRAKGNGVLLKGIEPERINGGGDKV
jgi:hypothetical protein